MKKHSSKAKKFLQLNPRTLRIIFMVVFLTLFVLAAGAPSGMGGVGMNSMENSPVGGQCRMRMKAIEHMSLNAPVQIFCP